MSRLFSKKKNQALLTLTPRWIPIERALKGWVVIHPVNQEKFGGIHLSRIKLKCIDTNKKIYCRIHGPGTPEHNPIFYKRLFEVEVKESIMFDAYFKQKLDIEKMGCPKKFEITKLHEFSGQFKTWWYHPEDVVRVGVLLGIISVFLGVFSLLIAFIL